MTDERTAVVDRIVDGETAVLLLEADNEVVDEITLPVDRLPEAGRHDGAVYGVEENDGERRTLSYRPEESRDRRERAQDRFDQLSDRLGEE
ncbi:DUF3006 domain-containing protein [Halovivax limisalsi]|uniref:DUF3006 domain-containing protein n=1 Tax=Halovivax limisalsi TaxID=1453760 RepID=UPI001FFD05EA|nr:DUF3006 domain-containing protein [Halovivax limisalsi]